MEQLESIKMAYGDNSWKKLQLVIKVSSVHLLSQILKLVFIKTKKSFFWGGAGGIWSNWSSRLYSSSDCWDKQC